MNGFARKGQVRGLDLHPTVKPLLLVQDAILDVTARNEIVLDPFAAVERPSSRLSAPADVVTASRLTHFMSIRRFAGRRSRPNGARHANGKTFDEMREEREVDHVSP